MRQLTSGFLISAFFLTCASPLFAKPAILRTPNGGIQPQAAMDGKGVLHLIYFKGKDGEGDIFYVRREPGRQDFSQPIQVNSQPGSAIAVGTIRGAQLGLGKNGRVHVAWNGSKNATPKGPNNGNPMLYTRLDGTGKAFEPQRNLMQQSFNLDGGGTVAADDKGNVYVAWHGNRVGTNSAEAGRQVWVARSSDDGKTFAKEELASAEPTGACGCCGMRAFADSKGAVHMLYRSASGGGVNRDMFLLTSTDQGKTFQNALVQKWKVANCPMSSEAFAEAPGNVLTAWETGGQVFFAKIAPGEAEPSKPVSAPGRAGERKHPAIAGSAKGETIMVWTEGTGWMKGGSLAWQVFDKSGRATTESGRVDRGIPVWGLPTVVATPEGEFVIVH